MYLIFICFINKQATQYAHILFQYTVARQWDEMTKLTVITVQLLNLLESIPLASRQRLLLIYY